MMKKRLYKDHSDKKICGVCSGIAKYFDIAPLLSVWLWFYFVFWAAAVFWLTSSAPLLCPTNRVILNKTKIS